MDFLLDLKSGIPIYRQIIEQVKYTVAIGDLVTGDQLPTVRQLAVDLSINPNTVARAYRDLEMEGILDTHQGSGTFVGRRRPEIDRIEKQRMLDRIVTDMLARASTYGFTLQDLQEGLKNRQEASS
jgi:GntR family transcriptional regulator